MNQVVKHFALHQQRIPKVRFPTGVPLHSSYKNRLAEIIQTDSNCYHQHSNNSLIKTVGNCRVYSPIYQDFVHPFS